MKLEFKGDGEFFYHLIKCVLFSIMVEKYIVMLTC